MATTKKTAAKKSTAAKKAPTAVAKASEVFRTEPAAVVAPAVKKGRGRPAGSTNKKSGKKSAGRPAATRYLYSVEAAPDELGLDSGPSKVDVVGPFPSEADAMADALSSVGSNDALTVTLYRDYRAGKVEVKTRLV